MELEHEERSGSVIGAAIEVYKAFGPLFLESVYALAVELVARGMAANRTNPASRIATIRLSFIGSQRRSHDFLASWLP
jgi:hypothetical protein